MALGQWIASTPKQIVKDTLKLSKKTLIKLKTEKQFVVVGTGSSMFIRASGHSIQKAFAYPHS